MCYWAVRAISGSIFCITVQYKLCLAVPFITGKYELSGSVFCVTVQ